MRRRAALGRLADDLGVVIPHVGGERRLDPVGELPALLLADERRDRPAQEPGDERAVEELELVVPGDERLPEREVDVLLPRHVDRAQPAHRISDPAGADLDPYFP